MNISWYQNSIFLFFTKLLTKKIPWIYDCNGVLKETHKNVIPKGCSIDVSGP